MRQVSKTLVVMPTFNEVESLGQSVLDLFVSNPNVDLLIVDDNSPDGTAEIAEELALPPVKIHCSILAEDAIKAAVNDYRNRASAKENKEAA